MRNSNWELIESKLRQPIQPPREFGRLKLWWDESPHSLLAALLAAGLVTLICLLPQIVLPPTDLGKPGSPDVKIEQVVLGSSAAVGTEASAVADAGQTSVVNSNTATRPVDPLEQVQAAQPVGSAPSPSRPVSDVLRVDQITKMATNVSETLDDRRAQREAKAGSLLPGVAGLSGLFNIASNVKSVVYVVDKSSSMTGQPLERVKAELIHGINAIKEDRQFGVVFFDDFAWPMLADQGAVVTGQSSSTFKMLPATTANKQKVTEWVSRIYASGGTNPVPAVSLAVGAKPQLITLLSDGEFHPTAVTVITDENQRVRGKRGRIDCAGLGEQILTLREIAAQNVGTYYQVRIGP